MPDSRSERATGLYMDIWDISVLGVSLYYIVGLLIVFSFLGWVWESCYVSVPERRLTNRGYVMGPLCTIYGVAVAGAYIMLKPFRGNYLALFLGGVVFATVLEYITFIVMEAVFHTSWWDYSDKKFNYKGRICLEASLLWGICAELLFTVLIPFFEWFTGLYSRRTGEAIYTVIFVMYLIDFTLATIAAADISKQIKRLELLLDEVGGMLKSSRLYSTSEEILSRVKRVRQNLIETDYLRRYSKRLEIMQAVWADQRKVLGIKESMTELVERLGRSSAKFEESWSHAKLKFLESRILRAYPKIKSYVSFEKELKEKELKEKELK